MLCVAVQPPAYKGAYQGYPQWCSGPELNATACWVGGGLCTSNPNATLPSFTQTEYETCMREQQTEQCLVPPPAPMSRDSCNRVCCHSASVALLGLETMPYASPLAPAPCHCLLLCCL